MQRMATPEELSSRYLEMSKYLIQKAQQELDRGDDLMQASEKAWGAVAHGIKSIAALRGWNHHHHLLLEDLAVVLQWQTNSTYILDRFDVAEKLHTNFYENRLEQDTLQHRIDRCRELRDELERIRTVPSPTDVPEGRIWDRRMRRLTNRDPVLAAEEQALDITALPPVEAF